MKAMNTAPPAPLSDAASPDSPVRLRRPVRETVLAYHELSDDGSYTYSFSSGQFEEHLQLARNLDSCSANRKAPLTFTFDDGHISNYTRALPLLEKHSRKATFFVIAGRMGESRDFLTWPHLREMISLGHCVGSHSWSHKFLTECADAELDEELLKSRETLSDRLGVAVEAISVPHGRWDRRVLRACVRAGYRRVYTSDPWFSPRVIERAEVAARLVMVNSTDASRLLRWLTMRNPEMGLRRAQHALKQSAQKVLGNKLYYQLWARLSGWKGPDDVGIHEDSPAH